MPKNFNDAPAQAPKLSQMSQAITHPDPLATENDPMPVNMQESKAPSLYETITAGLTSDDIRSLDAIRDDIIANEFIVKCLFSETAMLDIKVNKHVKISVRMLTTDERDNLEAYLYAKDVYGLYASDDEQEINTIMKESALDYSNAKDLFLRTFPRGIAQNRYVKTAVALSVLKINGKSTGADLRERFNAISKLPAILTQQIQGFLTLLERAVKLELSDENAIKN